MLRAVDAAKDQSYVLGVLDQSQLSRSFFPLGDSVKADVRAEAHRRGLAVAEKPDSHDICFIADGDTAGFLDRHLGERPGPIVDEAGRTLGEHGGAHQFTVGQRRGLRLGTPAPDGQPRFVLDISPVTNTVTVGPRDALAVTHHRGSPAHLDRRPGPGPLVGSGPGPGARPGHAGPDRRRRRPGADPARRAGHWRGPRAGRGALRRAARRGQRDHLGHRSVSADVSEPAPVLSTGIGSWPGTDMADAVKIALAECPELSYPARAPGSGVRTLSWSAAPPPCSVVWPSTSNRPGGG